MSQGTILENLIAHINGQRKRAGVSEAPFDLGIVTDKRPSQVLAIVQANLQSLKEIGMTNYTWHNDALRSELTLADEKLLISVCRPR